MVICSTDAMGVSLALPFAHSAILSGRIGTRRKDAPKRAENKRVPERRSVVPIASGELGADMALPVFDIANLGISHRKKVVKQPQQ
jgi:hypothetical protein